MIYTMTKVTKNCGWENIQLNELIGDSRLVVGDRKYKWTFGFYYAKKHQKELLSLIKKIV